MQRSAHPDIVSIIAKFQLGTLPVLYGNHKQEKMELILSGVDFQTIFSTLKLTLAQLNKTFYCKHNVKQGSHIISNVGRPIVACLLCRMLLCLGTCCQIERRSTQILPLVRILNIPAFPKVANSTTLCSSKGSHKRQCV